MPIWLMVASLQLKGFYNLGNETQVRAWVMNTYMQYFCGEAQTQHKFPCDSSDLAIKPLKDKAEIRVKKRCVW